MEKNRGENFIINKMENNAEFRADYEKILQVFGFDEADDAQSHRPRRSF